jgi:hypothetical protein
MLAARILIIVVALVLVGLIVAYVISGNRRYLGMAKRLGIVVGALLLIFFGVLIVQNWS